MNQDKLRQWVNVLATLVVLTVNGLATSLPLNGQTTGEISDRFKVFFVPAGYVFAIWGIIYIGLLAFAVYQALPSQRENSRLRSVGWLYVLNCLANSVWIFLWHYNSFVLTLLVMLALLASLIAIYLRLGIGQVRATGAARWCLHVPFSIYLGWITVATVANATDVLNYLGWGGGGIAPQMWAAILLVVATALSAAMSLSRRDIGYSLVLVWAFAGIAVKQWTTPLVAITALVMLIIILGVLIVSRLQRPPDTFA